MTVVRLTKYEVPGLGFITETCINCGIAFGVPRGFYDVRVQNGKGFFCPNGHEQHYTQHASLKAKADALERQNQRLREQVEREERRARAYKGQATKSKNKLNRVSKGVCPCCKRSFENLKRHMESKHPNFGGQSIT